VWVYEEGHDDVLSQRAQNENPALHFPSFENGDGIQKLVASIPFGLALGECELHTLEHMK
jgi:hypothetical protein